MTQQASSFLDDFKWYMSGERRLSPNTVESYRFDLVAWREAGFDPESAVAPPVEKLRTALFHFDRLKLSPATLARRSASLRLFVKFRALRQADWEKLLEEIPVSKISESFPKALTKAEIGELLDFEPKDSAQLRDRAILELMYASGVRVSEAIELKVSEVDERGGLLRVLGKGSKERLVPYTERAGEWLERYREQVRPLWLEKTPRKYADHLFLSRRHKPLTRMGLWKILHKRSLLCGVDRVHPHILRHSFASHLLQGGADIRFVQALLGHSSLGTTERYIKVADDELKRVFEEFHPLP